MTRPQREMIILIGAPGVGKSRYAAEFISQQANPDEWKVLSFDAYMEAKRQAILESEGINLTNSAIMETYGKEISDAFNTELRQAVQNGINVIIDMVHATEQVRAKRVNMAKASAGFDYTTEAIFFNPPEEAEHLKRLQNRTMDGRFYSNVFGELLVIEPLSNFEKEQLFDKVSEFGPKKENSINHEYRNEYPSFLLDLLSGKASPNDLQR